MRARARVGSVIHMVLQTASRAMDLKSAESDSSADIDARIIWTHDTH
jgi:hypothetical protein